MPLIRDPFLDTFFKLFVTIVGGTLVAGFLWRVNHLRKKRKRREAWLRQHGHPA